MHTHTHARIHPYTEKYSELIPLQRNFLSIFHENPIIYCQFIACDSFFVESLQFFIRISMMTFIRSMKKEWMSEREWESKKLAENKIVQKKYNSNSIHLSQSNRINMYIFTLFRILASSTDVWCTYRIYESRCGVCCSCYSISISVLFFCQSIK